MTLHIIHPANIPTAAVIPYAAATAPGGWLACDGSAVSRATFAELFAVIGTTYGVGDGSTTFNVPDLRGRAAVGLGTHADVNALNDNDGVEVGSRTPSHTHGPGNLGGTTGGPSATTPNTQLLGAAASSDHTHDFAVTTGVTGAAATPFLTLQFIIKT